jgi:hypothetical protein
MQEFQEEVKFFLADQLRGGAVDLRLDFPHFLSLSARKWPYEVILVFHLLDESTETHLAKINRFQADENFKIIHLWEDLWKYDCEKVKSRLVSVIGKSKRLHGRESTIRAINNDELVAFLTKNHLNVPIKAKYKYGLYHEELLVAVMSFSKSRNIKRGGESYNSFELLRFCNKLNHTVVGGFTKLLEHFIKAVKPDDIMTYVDKDWSEGLSYQKAGFVLVEQKEPLEFWLDIETGQRLYPGRNESIVPLEDIEKGNTLPGKRYIKVFNSGSYKFLRMLK